MANEFSENLKRIRKEKGVTQEQLGDAVGVSAQAVSKWEQGSFPDASLLPVVADYLGIRIDELFGRREEYFSLEQFIVQELNAAEHDEEGNLLYGAEGEKRRMQCVWRLCHILACAYMRCSNVREFSEMSIEGNLWGNAFTQIVDEGGFLQAKLNKSLQYFLIMPQPEEGYDNPDALAFCEDMEELFRFLGQPNVLRVLIFLAQQDQSIFFDYNTLKEELLIDPADAEKIVEGLLRFRLVVRAELKRGGENELIYQYRLDCNLISFLTFTHMLINPPHNFSVRIQNRKTPYFQHSTYKKPAGM
ncbi:MAG: helix-turn-helix domain-containing protein [Lachnospiraceae bacterium]|nr:helix-turn-helix domain-containing protein [Lachnospiraceae bacterium]